MIVKPSPTDIPNYFNSYFELVLGEDLLKELQRTLAMTMDLFGSVPAEKGNFRYAAGKWSIKEVLKHINDCERIFTYRAFRFSRFDKMELQGFDEDAYISNIQLEEVAMEDILAEYNILRQSSIQLFKDMSQQALDFKGTANKLQMTARGLGYMIVGHNLHHCNVITDRYLSQEGFSLV